MITTQKSFPTEEALERHRTMYLSIGYQPLKGRRVPNGTRHKLLLIYRPFVYTLYHV